MAFGRLPFTIEVRTENENPEYDFHSDRARFAIAGPTAIMRDDYLLSALKVIDDRNILVNVVSRRVKQLRRGSRPLVESLEKLSAEDTALREIAEGKISYQLATPEDLARR
jgi:DNA-directed RNA polymerase subunit omega